MNEETRCQMIAINVNSLIEATGVKDDHIMAGALDCDKAYRIDKIITECRKDIYQFVNVSIDSRYPHYLQLKCIGENKHE